MAVSQIPAPARLFGEATPQLSPARPSKQPSGLLASLNPLHHIPVVSAVYDNLTGTRAVPAISIMVGAALAGPVGFIAALANALLEESTGNTLAGHAVAAVMGEPATAVADGSGLGSPVSQTGAVVEDSGATSAIFDQRGKLQFNRNESDIQTAREVARAYLLELALRHPLRPVQSEAESAAG